MEIVRRNPVFHSGQPSVYEGDYQVTDEALARYGVSREKFGTTDIILPDGSSFNVKDYQYFLENGQVGMHFVPINEYGTVIKPDGKEAWASQLVDELLRDKMKIGPEDSLYAFMYFIHPELCKNTLPGFAKTDKVEMGITHMGAYYGQGVTSNSPPFYHNRKWGVEGEVYNNFGYPCNVMVIRLQDVDQATLNKNFLLTDKFLNYGIRFPMDYKNSQFRMVDFNTSLMFYRDWIKEKHYLKSAKDSSWFTYCAAHKTLVTTVALNLPHNRQSFMDVYGDKEGSAFFDLFIKNYFELFGEEFTPDLETNFEPLWKKEGLTATQIKPFTYQEYTAYDTARRAGKLATFTGRKPLNPTQGTGWGPQSTADVIFCFVDAYADFLDAGAIISCATIMSYFEQATTRLGISEAEYLLTALPILEILMEAHAMIYAPKYPTPDYNNSPYYSQTFEGLFIAYGGKKENMQAALLNIKEVEKFEGDLNGFVNFLLENQLLPEYLAWWSMWKVRQNWELIIAKPAVTPTQANDWMMNEIIPFFDIARNLVGPKANSIEFNTTPSIAHMIEVGYFPKNKFISIQSVCTVMNHTELEPKKNVKRVKKAS